MRSTCWSQHTTPAGCTRIGRCAASRAGKKKGGRAGMSYHLPTANRPLIAHRFAPSLAPLDIVGNKFTSKSSIDCLTGSLLPPGVCDMLYPQMAVLLLAYSRCAMFCRLLFGPRCSADCRSETRDAPLPAYSRYAMIFRRLISGARCYSAGLPCLHRYASIFFAIASRS